jgi:hypothetical protein
MHLWEQIETGSLWAIIIPQVVLNKCLDLI